MVLGAAAVAATGLAACGPGDGIAGPSATSDTRAPGVVTDKGPAPATETAVLARAASQPIESGMLEITASDHHAQVRFDGDDLHVAVGDPASAASGATPTGFAAEFLLVDGTAYLRAGERWITIPGLEHLPVGGATAVDASGTIDRIRGVLDRSAVTAPGEPATVYGIDVTRYRAQLTGREAVDLLSEAGTAAKLLDGDERGRRILGYGLDHTTVDMVGDVDADGRLRRLEITSHVDNASYPDCSPLSMATSDVKVVLSGIGTPQDITAPPAESVGRLSDLDPTELLGGLAERLGEWTDRDDPGPLGSLPTSLDELYAGCPE